MGDESRRILLVPPVLEREGGSAAALNAQLRDDPELEDTKLMIVTSAFGGDGAELLDVPCDAHLIAPFEEEQLLQVICTLLTMRFRAGPRVRTELLAEIEETSADGGETASQYANILEISTTGLLLECEQHLTVGAIDTVRFFLPGTADRIVVTSMVLVADELRMHYAGEFVAVPAAAGEAIREFIESELARKAGA